MIEKGVEIAEQHQRDFGSLADAPDQIKNTGKCRARLQSAFRSPLNRGSVGKRIAEWHPEFHHVRAGIGKGQDEFERRIERRVARGKVGDDAEFSGLSQGCKSLLDSCLQNRPVHKMLDRPAAINSARCTR